MNKEKKAEIEANRGVNLKPRWDKKVSDKWDKKLKLIGIYVRQFHFKFHYPEQKGDGATFEAQIDITRFVNSQDVEEMIRGGVDIMLIRKMKEYSDPLPVMNLHLRQPIGLHETENGKSCFDYKQVMLLRDKEIPSYLARHSIDGVSLETLRQYLHGKLSDLSNGYYTELRTLYSKLISKAEVAKTLRKRKEAVG